MKQNIMSWDEYFIMLAHAVSMRSKDMSTRVGCIIVGEDNEIRSTGYNGFPRGVNDDIDKRYERPDKYLWIECAERNAVYNAARTGVSLKGSRAYTTFYSCPQCARALVQVGINEMIYHKEFTIAESGESEWDKTFKISEQIFKESGIKVREYSGPIENIVPLKRGKFLDLNKK